MLTETSIGAWLLSKIAPTLAALFGGLSLVLFWTPEKLLEKGRVVSIFLAGAMSATAGFAFTGVIASALGVDPDKMDVIVGLAWIIGFFSIAIFNWLANFISKRASKDILEVYQEVNEARKQVNKTNTPAPAKRTRKVQK